MKQNKTETWTEEIDCAEIPPLIRSVFDFLISDFGFASPIANNINSIVYNFSYLHRNIGIEPLVDRKEGVVEVCLVHLEDGIRPKTWKMDSNGQLVMVRLFEACWHRRVPSPHTNIPPGTPGKRQLELLLAAEQETLQKHFDDVLHDSDTLFTELNKKRMESKAMVSDKSVGPKERLP